MTLGKKSHKPSGLARCKRCGVRAFAWDRSPATGQQWRLYSPSVAQPDGMMYADLDKPHHCAAPEPAPTAPPPAVNPDEAAADFDHEPKDEKPRTPGGAGDLAATIAAAVAPFVKGAVDADTVRRIVREEISQPSHQTLTVRVERPDGTEARAEMAHPNQPRRVRYVAARRPCYLHGPAGSSKTTSACQAAELAGLRHAVIALSQTTTASMLFGFIDAQSNYRPTILRDFYENGGAVIFDEFDNTAGNVSVLLNGLLENGRGAFPDGPVKRHPDFVVIATGNTNLRGATRNHSSRTSLDLATVARFAFIEWPYDLSLEESIVRSIDEQNAPAILAWVRKVREIIAKDRIEMTVAGPREALNIARDLKQGEPFPASAESWVWRGLDPATRDRILATVPYPKTEQATA